MVLRQGLADCFRDANGFRATVYVNDCDQDVCLSWFLLKYAFLAEQTMNPLINRLVALEDALDATAGAYPFPIDLPMLGELAWIFEPYQRFRGSGELDRREPAAFRGVITDVEHRILRHIGGDGDSLPLDTRDRRLGGSRWALVEEIGSQARTAMFADGIRAFVAVRERPDGRWTYTIGRMSPFVPFDVPGVLAALNEVEGTTTDCWGGSNTVGGSPRVGGSKLSPSEVERVVSEFLGVSQRDRKSSWESL
jgi:hypothetical protein